MKLLGAAVLVATVLLGLVAFVQSAAAQTTKPALNTPKQKSHPESVDDWPDYKPPPAATKQEEDPWRRHEPPVSHGSLPTVRASAATLSAALTLRPRASLATIYETVEDTRRRILGSGA